MVLALVFGEVACFVAPSVAAPVPPGDAYATLAVVNAGRQTLFGGTATIEQRVGDGIFIMMEARLNMDADGVRPLARPADYPEREYGALKRGIAMLDARLVDQLRSGEMERMSNVRGSGDVWIRSSVDGTLQPVGLYVPRSYDARVPMPLVVFLHGRHDAEGEIVASPLLQQLAETAGAILIAPYARGDAGYDGAAAQDVYDALDAATRAFSVDEQRIYLAGFSMGAFAVFRLAALRADRWRGLLAVAGALTDRQSASIAQRLRGKDVFLAYDAPDEIVAERDVRATAGYLRAAGVSVHEYRQTLGHHALYALEPALRGAWKAMLTER